MRHTRADSPRLDLDRLREMDAAGAGLKTMADELGVTVRTICRYRRVLGLSRDVGGARVLPEDWRERAARLLGEGYSQAATAEVIGVATCTVQKYFPGSGWTPAQCGTHAQLAKKLNKLTL